MGGNSNYIFLARCPTSNAEYGACRSAGRDEFVVGRDGRRCTRQHLIPGIDVLGPEALLHKTSEWLGATAQGWRLDLYGCIPKPREQGIRCATAANGQTVAPAAKAGQRIVTEFNAYAQRAIKGEAGVIREFGSAC